MTTAWEAVRQLVERSGEAVRSDVSPAIDDHSVPSSEAHPFTVVLRSPTAPFRYLALVLHGAHFEEAVSKALEDRQDHDVCAVFRGCHQEVWND